MTGADLLHDHAERSSGLPGAGAGWIDALRASGARRFASLGLPTQRVEDWKYTDLRTLGADLFGTAAAANGAADLLAGMEPGRAVHRAAFANGSFDAAHSDLSGLPAGVTALPLARALDQSHELLQDCLGRIATLGRKHFVALNTAWLGDGFVLHVPAGVAVEQPIELVFAGAAGESRGAWHPRILVVLGPGASATVVERHAGTGGYLANTVAEVALAAGARLGHYRLQDESADAVHVSTGEVRVSADAHYESFVLSTGASVARSQIAVELQQGGASCSLNGAYLGRRRQQLDTTTLIDHAAPDCTSSEVYKGVLDDRSRGVFQGRIVVRKHAQRTDSHQSNKALLLSERAEVDAKPELEIHADDVRCGHGATVGELDEDALFYLRSRGIPLARARGMLIEAFVEDAIGHIGCAPVRETFRAHAAAWHDGDGA